MFVIYFYHFLTRPFESNSPCRCITLRAGSQSCCGVATLWQKRFAVVTGPPRLTPARRIKAPLSLVAASLDSLSEVLYSIIDTHPSSLVCNWDFHRGFSFGISTWDFHLGFPFGIPVWFDRNSTTPCEIRFRKKTTTCS